MLGVLGVDPDLDGVPVHGDVVLGKAQRLAASQPQLQLDQVDPGDRLGHRVLHLEPGVHLEEEHLVSHGQELDGAKASVRNMSGDSQGGLTWLAPGRAQS